MNGITKQVPAEILVAFDIETGEVVQVHEWIVDRLLGNTHPTRKERDALRKKAMDAFPSRAIDVTAARPMLRWPEADMRYRVNPATRLAHAEAVPNTH